MKSLKEKADLLIKDHSLRIISDILGFEPKKNKPFIFSDDSKEGNDYLYHHPDGFYGIKNFSTEEFYNPIQAYQFIKQCDLKTAVDELSVIYLVHENSIGLKRDKISDIDNSKNDFNVSIKEEFDDYDIQYWLEMGISVSLLRMFNVHSLQSFSFENNGSEVTIKSSEKNPIFAYQVSENCYKIYQPKQERKYKFRWLGEKPRNFHGIFGADVVPENSKTILICEGFKDALAVNANLDLFGEGTFAVGKDNAQAEIPSKIIELLKAKSDEVILCFDNDEAGKAATKKHSARHLLKYLVLPKAYHCKDMSELIIKYHKNEEGMTRPFFKSLLKGALTSEPEMSDFDNIGNKEKVLFRSKQVMKAIRNTIYFRKPLIVRDKIGVIYPNTINIIQGGFGTHKSRFAESICSAFLSNNGNEILGFKTSELSSQDIFIVHVDTERNVKDQLPLAYQQMVVRAGYLKEDLPSNFLPLPLVDVPREYRFETLEKLIKEIKEKTNKHVVVFLDVVTDCNQSFNDAKDSLELIDMMNKMINRDNITFICVIHENPGAEKARGHLGTEAANKSTTIFQLKREDHDKSATDSDIFRVRTLKSRMTRRPDDYYIYYDQESKGLKLMDDLEVLQSLKKEKTIKAPIDEIKPALISILDKPLNQKELIDELKEIFDASKNTLKERLNGIQDGEIIYGDNAQYKISIYSRGRSTIYELNECKEDNNQSNAPI